MSTKTKTLFIMAFLAIGLTNPLLSLTFDQGTIEQFVHKHRFAHKSPAFNSAVFSKRMLLGALAGGLLGGESGLLFSGGKKTVTTLFSTFLRTPSRSSLVSDFMNFQSNIFSLFTQINSQLQGASANYQDSKTISQLKGASESTSSHFYSILINQGNNLLSMAKQNFSPRGAIVGALFGAVAGALNKHISNLQKDANSPSLWRQLSYHVNPFNGFGLFNIRFYMDEALGRNALEFYKTHGPKSEFNSIKNILADALHEYNLLIVSKASESKIRAFYSQLGQTLREEVSRLKAMSRYPLEAEELKLPFKTPEVKQE